jgi:signal transduction histidine kinase
VITDSKLTVVFRDNGIGISDDYINKIFDMFFRATDRSEGAGLGLYIVKETIDKLHGDIIVESTMGEGTTFKINVPNMKAAKQKVLNSSLVDTMPHL